MPAAPLALGRVPRLVALVAAMFGAKLAAGFAGEGAVLVVEPLTTGVPDAVRSSSVDRTAAPFQRASVLLAKGHRFGPAPVAVGAAVPALVVLAKPVNLGSHGRGAALVLALVRLAVRAALVAGTLAARIPQAGVLGAVLAPHLDGLVAPGRGASMFVAGLAVALDLADARAPADEPADVVSARYRGAGFDGLVAGEAAGPLAGVLAAVGPLESARPRALLGLAGVIFAGVSENAIIGLEATFARGAPGILAGVQVAKGARVQPGFRAGHQIAGVLSAISASFGPA